MAHRLVPREGQPYLTPRVVVARLLSEFPYVTSSNEGGRGYVRGIIRQLRAIKQSGDSRVDSEYLDRLERVQDGAIYVHFEDWNSEAIYLSTAVIPGEPLCFFYSSSKHEQAAKTLLLRCAAALDYDIVDM
jgi:hypothetical protein